VGTLAEKPKLIMLSLTI